MKIICMIPARLGSRRVKGKALRKVGNFSLLAHAIRTALQVTAYDGVWVNTPDDLLADEAYLHGAQVHKRPPELAEPNTNDAFKREFSETHPEADWIVAQNPTSPLLSVQKAQGFCERLVRGDIDTLHSVKREQAYYFDSRMQPVNFDWNGAPDTQDLPPVWRVVWAMTGWRRETYLAANCGVWAGRLGFYELSGADAVDIDTEEDLEYAQWLAERR